VFVTNSISSMPARNPFDAPHVESRRGGPRKQPLSRDVIVAEALRQITSAGVKGTSLRSVAAALETGPATLYAYIEDLDELHALVLDRALGKVNVRTTAATGGWRPRLVAVLRSYALVLSASPGLAQLAFGTVAVGPNALRVTEALLALLEDGGIDPATGAWAVDLLTLYVTAIVAEHATGLDPAAPEGAVARAIAEASSDDYPRVAAARAHLLSGSGEERFAWAVDVLLNGMLHTPRTAPAASAAPTTKTPTTRAGGSPRTHGPRKSSRRSR
jgi:AcrR family transcriptional regulator